jgi:hypothetical protein
MIQGDDLFRQRDRPLDTFRNNDLTLELLSMEIGLGKRLTESLVHDVSKDK